MLVLSVVSSRFPYMSILISGGYSDGAPPLPIPNREVKPVRADGTASSGRVGSRRFFPEESGSPHNVECRISGFIYLYSSAHEGCFCFMHIIKSMWSGLLIVYIRYVERSIRYMEAYLSRQYRLTRQTWGAEHTGLLRKPMGELSIHPCKSERAGLYILWYIYKVLYII